MSARLCVSGQRFQAGRCGSTVCAHVSGVHAQRNATAVDLAMHSGDSRGRCGAQGAAALSRFKQPSREPRELQLHMLGVRVGADAEVGPAALQDEHACAQTLRMAHRGPQLGGQASTERVEMINIAEF